jgi:recombination protein RecT
MNQSVQTTQPQVPAIIQKLRQPMVLDEFAKVLPKGTDVARLVSTAMLYILNCKQSQDLLNCDPVSVLSCIKKAFSCGLELDGRNCHLIPYGRTCEFQFDWKGIYKLALDKYLESAFPGIVYSNDTLECWVGENGPHFKHVFDPAKDRGEVVCYYSWCRRRDSNIPDVEYMTPEQVQAVQKRSKARSGPWQTDFDEMAKKTVIKRHSKRWDISPEFNFALEADDKNFIDVDAPPVADTGVAAMLNSPAPAALPAAAPVARRGRGPAKQVQAEVTPTPQTIPAPSTADPDKQVTDAMYDDSNPDLGPQTQAEAVRENVAPPSTPPIAQPSGPVSAPATAPSTASAPPRQQQKMSQLERIKRLLVDDGIAEDECMEYFRTKGGLNGAPLLPSSCANLEQASRLSDTTVMNKMLIGWDEMCEAVSATHGA